MNKGRNVFSQLCDLLIEQKEEESAEEKYQQLCLNFDG